MAMATNIHVVFYSMYGHIYTMADVVAADAGESGDPEVTLLQVAELVADAMQEKSGAKAARAAFAHVPVAKPAQLVAADAIIFGTPTRFGNMAAQMRNFLDQTGGLWMSGALVGKVGGVFTSTATQHGGQETTIVSFHSTLLHQGMMIVGVPYSEPRLLNMAEITGGSPYGASTLTDSDGSRQPSDNELANACFQRRHVTQITKAPVAISTGWTMLKRRDEEERHENSSRSSASCHDAVVFAPGKRSDRRSRHTGRSCSI
jgi:NAD(P)H:quinone oxidoreductase type IV